MNMRELYNKADYKDELGMCFRGDCLDIMKNIPDNSVDMILTDPPYGTTACKWDSIIPFNDYVIINNKKYQYEECLLNNKIMKEFDYDTLKFRDYFDNNKQIGMWTELNRIIKSNGTICLFGSEPFSSGLRMSNIKNYKYDWIYRKPQGVNPLLSKKQPLNDIENVSVFYKKQCLYNPQKELGKPYKITRDKKERVCEVNAHTFKETTTVNNGDRFPKRVLDFKQQRGLHPTQKPVPLLEYLIKTYTNENNIVLDFTMGSGSTCVGCKNTNRRYIGIELDDKYFDIACDRLKGSKDAHD